MRRLGLKIGGVVVAVIILLHANMNIVRAVTTTDIQNQENEKKETTNKINETKKELENVQVEKSETQKQVDQLSSQIEGYEAQIDTLNNQIADLNGKIEEEEKKLKEAEEDYTKQEDLLEKRLVATYEAGETSYLDFLLSSKNIVDFISNYYLVTEVATNDTELLEKIQKQKEEIEEAKKNLESNKQELATSKASKQSITTQLQTAKSQKNQQIAKLSDEEKALQSEIDELKNHESSISSQIAKLKAEYDKQQEIKNKPTNNTGNSGSTGGTTNNNNNNSTSSYGFGWPVSNNKIGTAYGVTGKYWSLGYHTGVDFPVSTGTPVFAVGDGQVFDTGFNSAYGYFVEIYHGNNVYSFYAHASSVQVSRGQMVSKGQQIMLSGATGNVSGPHLHFEIRSPGYGFYSCVNPMNYLP